MCISKTKSAKSDYLYFRMSLNLFFEKPHSFLTLYETLLRSTIPIDVHKSFGYLIRIIIHHLVFFFQDIAFQVCICSAL